MSTYYLSACHDCKERVMFAKSSKEQCFKWHREWIKENHEGHLNSFGSEYEEEFYDSIYRYKDVGEYPVFERVIK